jgi:anti-sigma B factor antagonist
VIALELTVQHPDEGTVEVGVNGALDLARAYDFDDAMRRIERTAGDRIVLDLRGVAFMDSAGLARLLAVRRRCRRRGRRLVLIRGSRAVQRVFQVTAIGHQFEVVSDRSEALTS